MAKTKTGITIDPKILQDMDSESKRINMSRSEFIEALMAEYIVRRTEGIESLSTYDLITTSNLALYKKDFIKYQSLEELR